MDDPPKIAEKGKEVMVHLDAHHRFIVASVLAVVAFIVLQGRAAFATQLVGAWDVFTFTLSLIHISKSK